MTAPLLWTLWQHSLAPWLDRLIYDPLSPSVEALACLPDPLALAACLLTEAPQQDWPGQILPLFEAWQRAENAAADDSRVRHFWLDLLAALLAQQAAEPTAATSETSQLPDFSPRLLVALWQALPAVAGSSQQLNTIYTHWRELLPYKLSAPPKARLLLHLLALCLGSYAIASPAQAAGIKPLLVVCLQRWFSQPLADQWQPLPAGWLALPGRAGAGYRWLSALQQQARSLSEALSFPQRNAVFQALEQGDGSLETLDQIVCKFMNRQLLRDNPLNLGWLDSLIWQTASEPGQQQSAGYALLGAVGPPGPGLQHKPTLLQTLVRVLPELDTTEDTAATASDSAPNGLRWQSWQECPAAHPARQAASSYPATLARYWQQPGPRAFARWGSQERFRTRWVPDGEIALYQLLDVLLQAHEADIPLTREALCQELILLQLLRQEANGQLQALPRYHALMDACERLLCPARTGTEEDCPLQMLQALLAPLYPGPVIDGCQIQRFVLACASWCPPAGVNLQRFRSQLCPLENYREEGLARSASPGICHSFLAPFSYLRDESLGLIPAAFVSGGCYQLDPPGARPLPFVASQYQHHVAAATPLLRLVFDHLLLNAQREAARYRQHLAEQSAREAHYLRLRQQLQDFQRQQNALQQAWQGIQQALEAPFLQRLGLHSQGTLETLFRSDAVLGSDASGRPLRASHRPGFLQQQRDLAVYLCFAASGDPALPPPAWPGSLPAALWQLSQQLPPEDLATARRCFGWLKLNTYDAWLPGSQGHQLQLGQLAQALWLANTQQQQKTALLWQHNTSADEDLSSLVQGPIQALIQAQPRLCGLDFARPEADTRQARPALPLHGPALAFCQQLQALMLQHLQDSTAADRVRLQRCEARWISGPTGEGLQLRLWCQGHFSPAALTRLQSPPDSGGSHDLRQLLQDLHSLLSGHEGPWPVYSGAPPDRAPDGDSTAGLSLWQLPGGQSVLQLSAGQLPAVPQTLARICFLDQGRRQHWQALGLQDLQPTLARSAQTLSSAHWRHWLAQQNGGLLVLHLHEQSPEGDYLLLNPEWLADLPAKMQVLLVSGGEPQTLSHWLAAAQQSYPAAAERLQLYPEALPTEATAAPSELEQLGWQQLLRQAQSQQPLQLGIFAALRELLALLEAWEDSGFAQQGSAWEALQAAATRWQLPAARLHSLPHDSLAAWRVWAEG